MHQSNSSCFTAHRLIKNNEVLSSFAVFIYLVSIRVLATPKSDLGLTFEESYGCLILQAIFAPQASHSDNTFTSTKRSLRVLKLPQMTALISIHHIIY